MNIFEQCKEINSLIETGNTQIARNQLIFLLDFLKTKQIKYTPLINHLIRSLGLFPYIDIGTSLWEDRFVQEAFKSDVGGTHELPLHIEQSYVLKLLLNGESIAISAPTSFGKSFIIDAFIAIKQPNIVVLIVPTIALADESRRRLNRKFSNSYKIITTTDASIEDKSIFVFPQERALAYVSSLTSIDILIVDEFYKASSYFDNRSETLLNTMIELGKMSKQRYYLAPNIDEISNNVFTEGMTFHKVDFNTVVTKEHKLFLKKNKGAGKKEFKKEALRKLVQAPLGKTLIYAGSYSAIDDVSDVLIDSLPDKSSTLLTNFSHWITKNYGHSFLLGRLVRKGVGIHNGRMHRALSQIQVKVFEEDLGIDFLVSTSSIIEGVNTQARNVILWSNRNGGRKIDFFTFRNIIGRAGRMFKYFVGHVYLLEEPPVDKSTKLNLDFPDDVVKGLDGANPGVELNNQQYILIKKHNDEMEAILGTDAWKHLKTLPQVKAFNPTKLKDVAQKIKQNPEWPKNFEALTEEDTWAWKDALEDVIDIAQIAEKGKVRTYVCFATNAWNMTIPEILEKVSKYEITIDEMFRYERAISYNLSSILSLINLIKQTINPSSPDISKFIIDASNAFLPKLVFQLEEYGLPRMISKKIQISGLIDLENNQKEIASVIEEFQDIGMELILLHTKNLDDFDKYIIEYFYEGIL